MVSRRGFLDPSLNFYFSYVFDCLSVHKFPNNFRVCVFSTFCCDSSRKILSGINMSENRNYYTSADWMKESKWNVSNLSLRYVNILYLGERCVNVLLPGERCVNVLLPGERCVNVLILDERCVNVLLPGERCVNVLILGKRCVVVVILGKRCVDVLFLDGCCVNVRFLGEHYVDVLFPGWALCQCPESGHWLFAKYANSFIRWLLSLPISLCKIQMVTHENIQSSQGQHLLLKTHDKQ